MPPKMQLMPGLRIGTRPSNKDKHPGLLLKGNTRRTSGEISQLREEAAAYREAEEQRLTIALTNVANIEDARHEEDNELDLERRQRREQFQQKGIASTEHNTASGTAHKTAEKPVGGTSAVAAASKRPERVKGKVRLIVGDIDPQNNLEGDSDSAASSLYKSASDSSDTDSEDEGQRSSDASEVAAKKKKKTKTKKTRKSRQDVRAMRKVTNTLDVQNNKRKAVPDGSGPEITSTKHKKVKKDDSTGFDPEWEALIKKRAARKQPKTITTPEPDICEDTSMVRYGGFISDNEGEVAESSAVKNTQAGINVKKPIKGLYASILNSSSSIQIQNNPNKTMKEARGGDEKWQDKHLPADAKTVFKEQVVPSVRHLLGTLEPWVILTPEHVQTILNSVFKPSGKYKAAKNEVFFNLAKKRIETWRNGFAQAAVQAVKMLIDDNAQILKTPADIKDLISHYLSTFTIGDNDTFAYQWAEWEDGGEGFCQNTLILRTFAIAHLAQIEGYDDFGEEKPIGALLMAMQAVGRALEIWKDGEKSLRKPPAFSYDNYGDTFVKVNNGGGKPRQRKIRRATLFVPTLQSFKDSVWERIIDDARGHLPGSRKRRTSSASAITIVSDAEDVEDPSADFVMAV